MNQSIVLRPSVRPGRVLVEGTKVERRFHDFIIDGDSLYALICEKGHDNVGSLGWGGDDEHFKAQARLLLIRPGDFSDGRVSLFICPECGDLGCGAVSARIRRKGQLIVWDEIGWQTNYEEGWQPIDTLGPFSFDFEQYKASIESTTLLESPPA